MLPIDIDALICHNVSDHIATSSLSSNKWIPDCLQACYKYAEQEFNKSFERVITGASRPRLLKCFMQGKFVENDKRRKR
jgi:hypothetical protein